MKTNKFNKKLVLNKKTIADLTKKEMAHIMGMEDNGPLPEATISCNGCTMGSCTFTCQC